MEGKLKLCFHQVQARFLEKCPCKQNCRFFPPASAFSSDLTLRSIFRKSGETSESEVDRLPKREEIKMGKKNGIRQTLNVDK